MQLTGLKSVKIQLLTSFFCSRDYSDEDDMDESVVVVEDDDDEGKSASLQVCHSSDDFMVDLDTHTGLTWCIVLEPKLATKCQESHQVQCPLFVA